MSEVARREASLVRWEADGRPAQHSLRLLGPGASWWEDFEPRMKERLALAVKRGEVVVLADLRRLPVTRNHLPLAGVLVRRMRPAAPRWRKPLLIALAVVAALALIGYGVHLLVQALFNAASVMASLGGPAALVVVLWILWSLAKGHPCPGLHCSGCKSGR